ncbi:MAG: hypothetical protein E7564_01325 [Ruminococcaceae bacterium]|nr:hypothetical protein [Oscillospiraceae bacterium]
MKKVQNRLICLLLSVFLLVGTVIFVFSSNPKVKGAELGSYSGSNLLTLESVGGDNVAVFSYSLMRFSSNGIIYSKSLSAEAMYAVLHGGSVYIASNSGGLTVFEYSASSGALIATHTTGVSAFSVRYITVDVAGGIYIVKSGNPTVLEKYSGGSLVYSYDFGSEINLIDSVNDTLYVHAGSNLYYGSFSNTPESFTSYALTFTPAVFLTNHSFITVSGKYVIFSGGEIHMKSGKVIPDKSCTFMNSKQPYYATSSKICGLFSVDTVGLGSTWLDGYYEYSVSGNVLGVNANGIVYTEGGRLIFKEHQPYVPPQSPTESESENESSAPSSSENSESSSLSGSSSTSSSSASSSSSSNTSSKPETSSDENSSSVSEITPSPNPLEELNVSGNLIYFNEKDKVSALKKTYGLTVYNKNGSEASGDIRTGMYTNINSVTYTLCVTGDTNGSGTVNSSDMSAVLKHISGRSALSGVYFTAADIDANGKLNTYDLYLLSKLISG